MGCYFFRLTELQLHVQICLELNMLCHFCWGTELPLRLRNTTACANCQLAVEFRGASFYNVLIPNDGRQHAVCSIIVRDRTPPVCLLRVNLSVTYYQHSGRLLRVFGKMNCFVARCKHYSVALPRKPAAQPLYNVIAANYINLKKKNSQTKKIFPIIWFVLKYFPMLETRFLASFKGLVWI